MATSLSYENFGLDCMDKIKTGVKFRMVVIIMFGLVSLLLATSGAAAGRYVNSGTAGLYVMRNPTACNQYGYKTIKYIAAASDMLWKNGSACGMLYNVTCIGSASEGCSAFSPTWTVTIVDYCPQACRTTIQLSEDVFQKIAPFTMGSNIISIEYTSVDGSDINPTLPPPTPQPPSGPIQPKKIIPPPSQSQYTRLNGTSPESAPSVGTIEGGGSKKGITLAASLIGSIIVAVCITAIYCWKRKKMKQLKAISELQANNGPISYEKSSIKRMIGPQREKLGEGGFGAVYKGKLPSDGRPVAVKLLHDAKGRGIDFINEVKCISRTSHNNCIKLLGYCVQKGERALIYEFMPEGSLEKFIHNKNHSEAYARLGWVTRHEIAVGIAKGLNYLHEDCKPAILHLDIKPHNILLDSNFTPKLSDFGLAKLCSGDRTSTHTDHSKGTEGYVAPEVHRGNYLSKKGDVYSYGVLLLEMVAGRKNLDAGVANTSKEIFSYWIHKRLDSKEDLELYGITSADEEEIARKMILVGLNCIQLEPADRPPMRRVLEMLYKSSGDLRVPPNPLSSGAMTMALSSYPAAPTPSVSTWPGTQPAVSSSLAMAEAPSFDGFITECASSYPAPTPSVSTSLGTQPAVSSNAPSFDGYITQAASSYSYTPTKEYRSTNPFLSASE